MLTDGQMAAYLEEGGARCPHCEDGGTLETGGSVIRCLKCGREWKDIYGLSSIEEDDTA